MDIAFENGSVGLMRLIQTYFDAEECASFILYSGYYICADRRVVDIC